MSYKPITCEWCGRYAVKNDILCTDCIKRDVCGMVQGRRVNEYQVIAGQTEGQAIVATNLVPESIMRACIGPEVVSAQQQVGDVGRTGIVAANARLRVLRTEFPFIPMTANSWPRGAEINV